MSTVAKRGYRTMELDQVLSEEQIELWAKATPQRKVWLLEFLRTGDPNKAARVAYPNMTKGSRYVISHRARRYFKVNIADIYRAQGIGELEVVTKTRELLEAKKKIRRFQKGDLLEEEEMEDVFAISKGLDVAIKLLGLQPAQKTLLGQDPDNPFTSLADVAKQSKRKSVESTVIEVPPE